MHFRFGIISENLKHPWKIWSMDNYSSSCLQNGNTDSNSVHPASLSISQKEQQVRVKVRHPVLPHGTSQQVRYLAVRILKKPPPPSLPLFPRQGRQPYRAGLQWLTTTLTSRLCRFSTPWAFMYSSICWGPTMCTTLLQALGEWNRHTPCSLGAYNLMGEKAHAFTL